MDMSFIYAKKKKDNSIIIFSDTKITDSSKTLSKLLWSDKTNRLVKEFGLIKSIIISEKICVSFAGNTIKMNELLSKINKLSLNQILKEALSIHTKALILPEEEQIDFMVCYQDENTNYIYEIKKGTCEEVNTSWLGSYDAFNFFQDTNLNNKMTRIKSNNPLGVEMTFGSEKENDQEFDKNFNIFHKTINDCGDKNVGGFLIVVRFDSNKKSFYYDSYSKSYNQLEKQVNNNFGLNIFQSSATGSFSILMYKSYSRVGLYIPQNQIGIIYNNYRDDGKDYLNSSTNYLFLPQVTNIQQLDFYIQVEEMGMTPPCFLGCNPDDINAIYDRITIYKDNNEMALLYINKAIEIITTQYIYKERLDELLHMKDIILNQVDE